jgi:hypothetical protein
MASSRPARTPSKRTTVSSAKPVLAAFSRSSKSVSSAESANRMVLAAISMSVRKANHTVPALTSFLSDVRTAGEVAVAVGGDLRSFSCASHVYMYSICDSPSKTNGMTIVAGGDP